MRTQWQQQLINSTTDPQTLLEKLELNHIVKAPSNAVCQTFKCRVPDPYLQRIKKGDPHDPLLKQVLPLDDELIIHPQYSNDPLQEHHHQPTAGLLQKYPGRVLLTLTGACAINCRYCFRRHFPYQDHQFNRERWQKMIKFINQNSTIHEVIFSGGDPLMLKDDVFKRIFQDLDPIKHVKTLRFHTRLPIVIPARITDEFTDLLKTERFKTVIVTHINHANEIDSNVSTTLRKIPPTTHLLNQAVLLKGVNDSAEALIKLSVTLFDNRIVPYYCHLLDRVQGATHFDVDETKACALLQQVRNALPGYLVPRLAREEAHQQAKTVIL
jgi:L-lysine 2,3-aminomutase